MDNRYFVREIKIQDYDWIIHAYERTVKEFNELTEAQSAATEGKIERNERAKRWQRVYEI